MKETGLILSTPMVKATLDGLKTMTRRVIVPQPLDVFFERDHYKAHWFDKKEVHHFCNDLLTHCPYGQVGDWLWIRETWTLIRCWYCDDGYEDEDCTCFESLIYKADKPNYPLRDDDRWKPSIFMPKKYARIWRQITEVRAERLQEITELDASNEGCCTNWNDYPMTNKEAFKQLWDSLNAKRGYSWESNPWVWVIRWVNDSKVIP